MYNESYDGRRNTSLKIVLHICCQAKFVLDKKFFDFSKTAFAQRFQNKTIEDFVKLLESEIKTNQEARAGSSTSTDTNLLDDSRQSIYDLI